MNYANTSESKSYPLFIISDLGSLNQSQVFNKIKDIDRQKVIELKIEEVLEIEVDRKVQEIRRIR